MLIDLLTSRCRSTQVKLYTLLIASIDLSPQEMFTFSEMLALVQSESSFSAFVFHRRPAGLQATSDLVACGAPWPTASGAIIWCAWQSHRGTEIFPGVESALGACRVSQVHSMLSENQFHCTRPYIMVYKSCTHTYLWARV